MTIEVIGAGFGRTGTMSLKVALETLGFGPCYHMIALFEYRGTSLYGRRRRREGQSTGSRSSPAVSRASRPLRFRAAPGQEPELEVA